MPAIRAQLVKWGNSQAVRIPKTVVEQARLQEGEELEIHVQEGRITIEPLNRRLTLESLVAGITPENRYKETDWGKAVGKEVW
ncbi:MAG: AbrB/MazE/SpoVT family DNA-binding domain-containing protein [Terriglobales bacterium]